MTDISKIKDLELLRLEAEYWRKEHFALTEEIRALPGYLSMEGLLGVVYSHTGGRAPSPVESRSIRIVLSQNKERHGN